LLTRRKLLILPKDEIVQIKPVETFIVLVEIPGKKFTVDSCEMSVESVESPVPKFSVDKPKDTLVLAELVCRIIILEKLETPEKIVVLSEEAPHAVNSLIVDPLNNTLVFDRYKERGLGLTPVKVIELVMKELVTSCCVETVLTNDEMPKLRVLSILREVPTKEAVLTKPPILA